MEEYGALVTDYIVTGGYPVDILPQTDFLNLRGDANYHAVRKDNDEDDITFEDDLINPMENKKIYKSVNPSTLEHRSVIFSGHLIAKKR